MTNRGKWAFADPEPYLLYNPDTDKVLPKPRDVYDGGILDQEDNEDEQEQEPDDDDIEVLESAPTAKKKKTKELPRDAQITLAAALQYKPPLPHPSVEIHSPRAAAGRA